MVLRTITWYEITDYIYELLSESITDQFGWLNGKKKLKKLDRAQKKSPKRNQGKRPKIKKVQDKN